MEFEVIVELKKEVLDAEGRAIKQSLERLGYKELKDVKVSKRFVIEMDGPLKDVAKKAETIAKEFLANPVSQHVTIRKLES